MPVLTAPDRLWMADAPLVLASRSTSRRTLLEAVGLSALAIPADVDERALEARFLGRGHRPEGLAAMLAEAKALAVSAGRPDAYCLGADQTLTFAGKLLHKPADLEAAASLLAALAGRTHQLTSAFCVARAGRALGAGEDRAILTMRALDSEQIATYLALAGPGVTASVGAYQLEGMGMHLFERVDGDHATVLGLPMLKLLAWLRGADLIAL